MSFALLEEKTGYSRDFNPGVFKKKVEVKFPRALGGWRAHEMRTVALGSAAVCATEVAQPPPPPLSAEKALAFNCPQSSNDPE